MSDKKFSPDGRFYFIIEKSSETKYMTLYDYSTTKVFSIEDETAPKKSFLYTDSIDEDQKCHSYGERVCWNPDLPSTLNVTDEPEYGTDVKRYSLDFN